MRSCCAFLTGLLLAGCAADRPATRGSTPAAWAAALCGGLAALEADQTALTAAFRARATTLVSQPAVSRKELVRAMDAVRADFATAVTAVQAVGPPAVPTGSAVQSAALAGLQKGETLYAGVTSRVQATQANGPALASTLQSVSADLAGGRVLTEAFDGLDAQDGTGRLTKALSAEPTCAGARR